MIELCVLFGIVLWKNIVFSNGAYTVQKVIFDRSVSLYTRVLNDMYEVEGYKRKETPVFFFEDWKMYKYVPEIGREFRRLTSFLGSVITYSQIILSFFKLSQRRPEYGKR